RGGNVARTARGLPSPRLLVTSRTHESAPGTMLSPRSESEPVAGTLPRRAGSGSCQRPREILDPEAVETKQRCTLRDEKVADGRVDGSQVIERTLTVVLFVSGMRLRIPRGTRLIAEATKAEPYRNHRRLGYVSTASSGSSVGA